MVLMQRSCVIQSEAIVDLLIYWYDTVLGQGYQSVSWSSPMGFTVAPLK